MNAHFKGTDRKYHGTAYECLCAFAKQHDRLLYRTLGVITPEVRSICTIILLISLFMLWVYLKTAGMPRMGTTFTVVGSIALVLATICTPLYFWFDNRRSKLLAAFREEFPDEAAILGDVE